MKSSKKTIAQVTAIYQCQLTEVSETPRLDVELFLENILAMTRAQLIAYSERELTELQQQQLASWVERRLKNEPVAYIIGHQPFWTLDLVVTPDTLIPRPETERLVDWICENFPPQPALRVADLGVGSGAIALALACERPLWHVDGVDKSAAALNIAKQNGERYSIENVEFFCGDWCSALPRFDYHLMVSNPPYIAEKDPHLSQLTFEPMDALVASENGTHECRKIIFQARHYLNKNGMLVLEHGADQQEIIAQLLQEAGYKAIELHRDFSNLPRFAVARWEGKE